MGSAQGGLGADGGPAPDRLRAALAEASVRTGFDQVTVVELVERAGVSRATFYRHYADKFALLREVAEPGVGRLRCLRLGEAAEPQEALVGPVRHLFEHVGSELPLYRSLLLRRPSPWFQRWLCQEFSSSSCLDADPSIRVALGWALVGLVSHWVDGGACEPPDWVARRYLGLLRSGPEGPVGRR